MVSFINWWSCCSFDAVLSGFYSLRYAQLDRALAEIARVLRPGGRFAVTLQGRRAIALAARLTGLGLLARPGQVALGARLLLGRERGVVLPTDVADAAEPAGAVPGRRAGGRPAARHAVPAGLTGPLGRADRRSAALPARRRGGRLGRDLIVLGRRA